MTTVTEKKPTNTLTPGKWIPHLDSLLDRCPERWSEAVSVFRKLVNGGGSNEYPSWLLRMLQLEIHPGESCWVRCPHCLGAKLRCKVQKPLPVDPILRLIDKLPAEGVERIEYAGIYTDPLTWSGLKSALEHCRGAGISVGVHTKFIRASGGLIEAMASTRSDNSCIAVSIDHFDPEIYDEQYRPVVPNALREAQANVERLCAAVCESGSLLQVSIRTLLVSGVTPDGLCMGADWIYGLRSKYPQCRLNWRISLPWIAAGASEPQPKGIAEQINARDTQAREEIDDCISGIIEASQSWPGTGGVRLREEPALSSGDCPVCFNQLLYGAIGADGFYYPCQGIASPRYRHLSYGNIHNDDDFVARRRKRTANDLTIRPGIDCPGCAAPHEAAVNRAVMEELNS